MLVRLLHAVRRVEVEWKEVKRCGGGQGVLPPEQEGEFELWWLEKKAKVWEAESKAKAMGKGLRVSVGWDGAEGGMDWVS